MNNFQNFGDLDDAQIRLRLREMLLHRATVDRQDYALFDEELDNDIAKDIEPDEDRDAFVANQTMGTGLQKVMACGMPSHMCMCDRGNGAKVRKVMKSKLKKIATKPKSEAVQEAINARDIKKGLRKRFKPATYNSTHNKSTKVLEGNMRYKIKKRKSDKEFNKAERAYNRKLYGLDKEEDEPYEPDESDTEWIGSGKPKRKLPQALVDFQKKVKAYRAEHGVSPREAMIALKKNK